MPFETKVYNYKLPKDSIKQEPYKDPNLSKLLIAESKEIIAFKNFASILHRPSLFIMNKSKVQNVRIESKKSTGGSIEVFILEIKTPYVAICLIKSTDKKIINKKYILEEFNFEIVDILDETFVIKFNIPVIDIINTHGQTPLPPYIKDDPKKYEYYNNQFADGGFSVASPTAGLHFTNKQINSLIDKGHKFIFINLDINIDTFKPVKEKYLEDHKIHKENYQINEQDFEIILQAKRSLIDIYCIGTTSLRAVESAFITGRLSSTTDYFIYPDTKINIPDYLITNFHAPSSSLLSIVDCIYGPRWKDLYNFALEMDLKFLSFGDAVLFKVNE
tara:strand:- start:1343 stop:2338 length:996 start_codon:yes stop_codon:yes gene_type:complete